MGLSGVLILRSVILMLAFSTWNCFGVFLFMLGLLLAKSDNPLHLNSSSLQARGQTVCWHPSRPA